ncbi:universal stress protein [Kaistia adipata]|uniref:universal stress protein n=1 Tax=Kaistia adipata TaxID=166954 RepID=UPI0004912D42|nr:universal stress protein [Kaistia adipata]
MDIKDISVVVDLAGDRPAARAAADLAKRLGAHLTGLSLAYDPIVPGYAVAPVPADFMISARNQALKEAETAISAFHGIAAEAGIEAEAHLVDVMAGGGLDGIVHEVRLADLVVIGEDDPERPEPVREALTEAILFNAGAPVLIVPRGGPTSINADRIMIAWDGTITASRAVRAAMPFLKMASHVEIVLVDDGKKLPTGERLCGHLLRHGVESSIRKVPNPGKDVAKAIRQAAVEAEADIIVMGAYGHSRLLEWILGGATRGMLTGLSLPVLMTH